MNVTALLRLADQVLPDRLDQQAERFQENADLYRAFLAEHGRAPEPDDDGYNDLSGWAAMQRPDRVTAEQLRQLEMLPHFTYGLTGAGAGADLLGQLIGAGLTTEQPAVTALARPAGALASRIAAAPWARSYVTWAIHCVRYGAEPTVGERGSGFTRTTRDAAPGTLLADARHAIMATIGRDAPLRYRRAAHRWERWTTQLHAEPKASSSSRHERTAAQWAARQRRREAAGLLTAEERAVLERCGLLIR